MITSGGAPFSNTNARTTEERFMRKMMKNKEEDDEFGIFGAEKYFKGVVDEQLVRTSDTGVRYCSNRPQEKINEPCPTPKPKTPSESSSNSRRSLSVSNGPNGNNHSKKTGVKSLLTSLGCNCSDKGSVKVIEAKRPVKGGDSGQKAKSLSSKRADDGVNIKREECFTFPVLNTPMADVKHPQLPEVRQEPEGKKSISLERKLTMLNWDGVTPRAEILDSSRNGGQDDTGSDGSSDLFEIESFSTNENNLFLAGQAIKNNIYAPSEASVDWSVATASVADFSTPEDLVLKRNVKGNSRILSGCKSLKAVRILGDDRGITSSDEKATVVSPARREWCNQLNSTTQVAKIQADTKLICAGSGLHITQNGFGVPRPVHRTHSTHASSHQLYMKQF